MSRSIGEFDDAASEEERSHVANDIPNDASIEKIIEHVLSERLGISQIDYSAWVKCLRDNLIFNRGHLSLLDRSGLNKLDLPLALKSALGEFCRSPSYSSSQIVMERQRSSSNLGKRDSRTSVGNRKRGSFSLKDDGSEVSLGDSNFGVTDEEREQIMNCWKAILNAKEDDESGSHSGIESFYSVLWREWLKVDDTAKQLFKTRSFKARKQHISRVMTFIMRAVEKPKEVQDYFSRLAIPHCIWTIQSQSYSAFGLSVITALESVLGDVMTSSLKEAWLSLISNLGERIAAGYDGVKRGWCDALYKRDGTTWKKVYTKLTNDTLYLYKSSSMKKVYEKYMFNFAKDISTVDDDSLSPVNKFCFYVQFGSVKKYFCATTDQNLHQWVENIVWRIKAYARLQTEDGDDGEQGLYVTTEEKKKMQQAKAVQTAEPGAKKKAKAANNKMVRIRKHLDAQIRKDSEFILFDNVTYCTIVINEQAVIEYANPAAIDLTGYEPSQLIGKNVSVLMNKSIGQHHDSYIQNYVKKGEAKIIGIGRYVPLKHQSGAEITCFLTVTEHTATGRRLFVGTLVEGNENESDSKSLSEADSSLNELGFALFDSLLQPTIVISSEAIIEYINPATEKYTKYSREELIGKNIKMLMDSAIGSKHDGYIKNYLATGESKIIGVGRDVPIQFKSGEVGMGHLEVTVHGGNSNRKYFIGTITPKEEISLESFVESHRDILGTLDVPTLIIGEDGIIHLLNKSAAKAFGYKESAVKGKNVNLLMTKDHARVCFTIQDYIFVSITDPISSSTTSSRF
eukprot:TRINITY_DN1434_c0_g1_i2.p1 TRINITY_DN1434_c0_g1~~TRINITY_DN1434_c0_g1_i2.p1  ORF type:complete len:796 (+),score=177.17 TRINITY_DN1434_c0_g1_i2:23-2410(+)